ncbi:MAG: hypothetical protein KAS32_29375 [Candidatus Peribacteraceae bacterium]|nr:hypothetical protein [Candidatus Peribacteraceae bacterium]
MDIVEDYGKWDIKIDGRTIFIKSEDLTHDVFMVVDGDFTDPDQKRAYAEGIVKRLNETIPVMHNDNIDLKGG